MAIKTIFQGKKRIYFAISKTRLTSFVIRTEDYKQIYTCNYSKIEENQNNSFDSN